MITVKFESARLQKKYFIVKVSYMDPITNQQVKGVNTLLETRLSLEQVGSILAAYCKDSYKLTILPVEDTKRFPAGYYESFTIDTIASDISRIRFIKHDVIEIPKVVYVQKSVETEL